MKLASWRCLAKTGRLNKVCVVDFAVWDDLVAKFLAPRHPAGRLNVFLSNCQSRKFFLCSQDSTLSLDHLTLWHAELRSKKKILPS